LTTARCKGTPTAVADSDNEGFYCLVCEDTVRHCPGCNEDYHQRDISNDGELCKECAIVQAVMDENGVRVFERGLAKMGYEVTRK
jgi:hypothetical protein